MALDNAYDTLELFKLYAKIISDDDDNENLAEETLNAASRFIDRQTGRTFYARTDTRSFDVPSGRELRVDDDLLTITTLTNGDDSVIADTEYILIPANVDPKFAIVLKSTSSIIWQPDSNSGTEQVISVAGTWGWVATAPPDIVEACRLITKDYLSKRTGQGVAGVATVTAGGIVLSPGGVPKAAMEIINVYRTKT